MSTREDIYWQVRLLEAQNRQKELDMLSLQATGTTSTSNISGLSRSSYFPIASLAVEERTAPCPQVIKDSMESTDSGLSTMDLKQYSLVVTLPIQCTETEDLSHFELWKRSVEPPQQNPNDNTKVEK